MAVYCEELKPERQLNETEKASLRWIAAICDNLRQLERDIATGRMTRNSFKRADELPGKMQAIADNLPGRTRV